MDFYIYQRLNNIEQTAQQILRDIQSIFGYCDGMQSVADTDFAKAQSPAPQLTYGNGFGNQQKSTDDIIKEIKTMIVELKIKGSVRQRENGLIELRSQALGSIYGRSKEEIEQKLTAKLKEARKCKSKKDKVKTPLLSEFFNAQYLPYKRTELSANTLSSYIMYMKRIANDDFDKPLNRYTTADIEKYLLAIPQTRTRQILRGLFNNIFTYAKRMGTIKNNPCDNVLPVKHKREVGRALPFEIQNQVLVNLFANDTITFTQKAYILFVYLTGTRRSEALSLTVDDVDFQKKVLHIRGTKTKGSDRYMPLTPLVEKLLSKVTPKSDGRYFPFIQHVAYDLMAKISGEYHLHELRHTFGTIAICVQKLDAKTVSLYMGHSTVTMTLTTYTHPEQLNQALFFDGSKTEEEKLSIMKEQYSDILAKICKFLE